MSVNLMQASRQWAERPADERFWNPKELEATTLAIRQSSRIAPADFSALRVEADNGEIKLLGKSNRPATLTNWAFGQLCARVGAPASYLADLPATLASQNINHGLKARADERNDGAQLLLSRSNDNAPIVARAFLGEGYQWIFNCILADRLVQLQDDGWTVPPARPAGIAGERTREATIADVSKLRERAGGLAVQVGDPIAPAGLYASDRDIFAFMVNEERMVHNPLDPSRPMARGFFLWNTEVGDKSFGITTFLYDYVCGNHIVWGAKDVQTRRRRHTGEIHQRATADIEDTAYAVSQAGVASLEASIVNAQRRQIATTKDDVIDVLFTSKSLQLTKGQITDAYERAEKSDRYGSPRSPWGMAQGLTELSQESPYANVRNKIDAAAGKILDMSF